MATWISRSAEGGSAGELVRRLRSLRSRRVGLAAGIALVCAAAALASGSSVFHVRRVEVTGLSHLRAAAVIADSGISAGTNALWLDEAAVAARLEDDPWVASATVSTSFPTTVRIAVIERSPVAVVRTPSGRSLVAGDGTILGRAPVDSALPLIVLPSVTEGAPRIPLMDPARAASALATSAQDLPARALIVGSDGALTVRLQGGILVRLGEADELDAKIRVLASVVGWARSSGSNLRTIDVSAPSAPAVTLAA